jgi:hypothetical protein
VLHKLDEQLLINNEQFDVLVRTAEAGREVRLTVIREGKPQTLTAKLVERELASLQVSMAGTDFDRAAIVDYPPLKSDYIALFNTPRPTAASPLPGSVSLRTPDGKQQINAARITIESDRHKMTVTNPDGRKHLSVEDKEGKLLFEGPVETPEELEKVPEELRQAYAEIFVDATAVQPETTDEKVADPASKAPARPTK